VTSALKSLEMFQEPSVERNLSDCGVRGISCDFKVWFYCQEEIIFYGIPMEAQRFDIIQSGTQC